MSAHLPKILRVYQGSDGDATRSLYERLNAIGPIGVIATNLFRAQKNSERAKVYRRRGHKDSAYDRKQWAMDNLCAALVEHAPSAGLTWGWGEDEKQPYHNQVLYIDLPTGQVSFHTAERGSGPDYSGEWDGVPGQSADRILRWVARVLDAEMVSA